MANIAAVYMVFHGHDKTSLDDFKRRFETKSESFDSFRFTGFDDVEFNEKLNEYLLKGYGEARWTLDFVDFKDDVMSVGLPTDVDYEVVSEEIGNLEFYTTDKEGKYIPEKYYVFSLDDSDDVLDDRYFVDEKSLLNFFRLYTGNEKMKASELPYFKTFAESEEGLWIKKYVLV